MLRFKVVSFLIFFFGLTNSELFAIQNKFDDKSKIHFTSSNEVIVEQEFNISNLVNQFNSNTNKLFYFSISPNQIIQTQIIEHRNFLTIPIFNNGLLPVYEDSIWNIESHNISQLKLKVNGYIWWHGYYLAVIELSSPDKLEYLKFKISINSTSQTGKYLQQTKIPISEVDKEIILNHENAIPYLKQEKETPWFYSQHPYFKIGIAQDGVYQITPAQLKSFSNFPTNVNPKSFQLFNNGIEIPFFVKGEDDGKFDSTDYIEFPAQKNYTNRHRIINHSEPYNEYLNRYTDTTWYWLTWGKMDGKRLEKNSANLSSSDTLFSYTEVIHIEENNYIQIMGDIVSMQTHNWSSRKLPIWSYLSVNQTLTQNFSISNLTNGNESINIFAKVGSFGAEAVSPAHKLTLTMDNFSVNDTLKLQRYDIGILSKSISSQNISEGSHSLKLTSHSTESKIVNDVSYDWFEIEYPRQLKVTGDSLIFGFRSLNLSKVRKVIISELPDTNFVIYRHSPSSKKISNINFIPQNTNWKITFTDTISSESKYFLWKKEKLLTPLIQFKQAFADLILDKKQTDYIIITHKTFKPEVELYKNFLNSEKKYSTRLIDVDDIYDEFFFGNPDPESIKKYLQTSSAWTLPAPKFLFLVGDASYDYKFVYKNKNAINFVPSIGFPVSDVAFTIWDSISFLPQLAVGRLPVNNPGEVTQYLQMRSNYDKLPNSEWNKRAIFFSSGDPKSGGQLDLFRSVNNEIIDKHFSANPIKGNGIHFYKTTNPYSDLGPYSGEFIKEQIGKGGTFISYIGHSGTQTWDNGIGDPVQLLNSVNRFSLMTDFGCSTGKFAEPQVKSFSELFLFGNSPSAIAYVGNSALGFVSLATTYPQLFYRTLLQDSFQTIGQSHNASKNKYLNQYGAGTISQILLYSNTLVGDPSVELAIPRKPNFLIENKSIIIPSSQIDDLSDSVKIKIAINNFGTTINDSVSISFQQKYKNTLIRTLKSKIKAPTFSDTISIYILTKKLAGEHSLIINLDEDNKINEISENDNLITYNFSVITSDFLIVQPVANNVGFVNEIIFLNPLRDSLKSVELQLANNSSFTNPINLSTTQTSAITKVSTSPLAKNIRYWWRIRELGKDWTIGTFFLGSESKTIIGCADSLEFTTGILKGISISSAGLSTETKLFLLKAISAGNIDGSYGAVEINGKNIIQNSYFRGFTLVTLDTLTFQPIAQKIFDTYDNSSDSDSLVAFINRIEAGTLTIAIVSDEASRKLSVGAKNALKLIGASKIDQLGFFDSYTLIGKKGILEGTALEKLVKSGNGKSILEASYNVKEKSGSFTSPLFSNLKKVDSLIFQITKQTGSKIIARVLGQTSLNTISQQLNFSDSKIDTLIIDSLNSAINISKIDCTKYEGLFFNFELISNNNLISPTIHSWKVGTTHLSDITLTSSGIKLNKKIIPEGEIATIEATFNQLGEATSDSMKVSLLTNDLGNERILATINVPPIKKDSSYKFTYNYDSNKLRGSHLLKFQIDPENKVRELFESNNIITYSYSVIADTIKPLVDITFDGEKIITGDFVSSTPTIVLKLFDNNSSVISMKDTSLCLVYLDLKKINYDGDILKFIPQNNIAKAEVIWKPKLTTGEHFFDFISTDAVGNKSDTVTYKLTVAENSTIINCYAIPNPFQNYTSFTFQFATPSISDDLSILIYTIAGRLIQKIEIPLTDINVGFNKIEWDGRDKDGDEIANGVYLYKLVSSNNNETISATQKLVKMK